MWTQYELSKLGSPVEYSTGNLALVKLGSPVEYSTDNPALSLFSDHTMGSFYYGFNLENLSLLAQVCTNFS
jgi:hypothetical protein